MNIFDLIVWAMWGFIILGLVCKAITSWRSSWEKAGRDIERNRSIADIERENAKRARQAGLNRKAGAEVDRILKRADGLTVDTDTGKFPDP